MYSVPYQVISRPKILQTTQCVGVKSEVHVAFLRAKKRRSLVF